MGIISQIFAPRHGLGYELRHCSVSPGAVPGRDGLGYTVEHGLEELTSADTVIITAYNTYTQTPDPRVLSALRDAAGRGARMVSICAAAFTLAAAGLLNGRRATTHWQRTGLLQRTYPEIEVVSDVLFVDDGDLLTSAGLAAGIDLCLHLVRRDHGVQASNDVARTIVAAPYRSGGQPQVIPRSLPEPLGDAFAATREWALRRLNEPIGVPEMARHARVSTRTFGRRFVEDTGYTPMQWILRARIDMARWYLESSALGVEQIAAHVGLGTGANLRMHFQRILGTTPSDYRREFGAKLAGSGAPAPAPAAEKGEESTA